MKNTKTKKMYDNWEIKEFMKSHALSEARLAQILGVTTGAVVHWVKNRRECPEIVLRLLRLFDETPSDMKYFESLESLDVD